MEIDFIKQQCYNIGFDAVGVTEAKLHEKDKENIINFIKEGYHGEMDWFPKYQDIRLEFKNLGFEPKSAICLAVIYNSKKYQSIISNLKLKISRYAIGKDYHTVIKKMGNKLITILKNHYKTNKFRQSVDTLPISEKVLSSYSGVGWIGKNTNLISKKIGSYFFLSVILTDLILKADSPSLDACGKCRKCLDACPTNALFEPYKIDASLCISHTTIENRKINLEKNLINNLNGWIYGCDICQEVCPFNIKAERNNIYSKNPSFDPLDIFYDKEKLLKLNEADFNILKKESAISRISYIQWIRNLNNVLENDN